MILTEEQQAVVTNQVQPGQALKIVAYAGTGKTSTFVEYSKVHDDAMLYLAFNKSVEVEAKEKFGPNVKPRTVHSLAYASFGRNYRKIGNLRYYAVAKLLKANVYIATLVCKTVDNYLNSADAEISEIHAAEDHLERFKDSAKSTFKEDLAKAAKVIWREIQKGTDQFPMTHSGYLKLYQLSKPILSTKTILLDEAQDCQPSGTFIQTPHGETTIEKLRVGDFVTSYSRKSERIRLGGCRVTSISEEAFTGNLVRVTTPNGLSSCYAPQHICIVKMGKSFHEKTLLYLMRRNNSWRVGITSALHGKHRPITGIAGRLWEERGDAAWILNVFDDRRKARLAEALVSARYGIPELQFTSSNSGSAISQNELDQFWRELGDLTEQAVACLTAHSRDVRYPLAVRSLTSKNTRKNYFLQSRASLVRACNLITGMEVLDANQFYKNRGNRHTRNDTAWTKIKVSLEEYKGSIWSLAVDKDNTYIADHIVTHNSNPVTFDIVKRQQENGARVLLTGDPYQQIYSWRGAVDAMDLVEAPKLYLTQSFRFGPNIARVANRLLQGCLEALLPVVGHPDIQDSLVDAMMPDEPYTIICRTNVELFQQALTCAEKQLPISMIGGDKFSVFLEAVMDVYYLYTGRKELIKDRSITFFKSFDDLEEFSQERLDAELMSRVAIVKKHGTQIPAKIEAIQKMITVPRLAKVFLVTAHKSKGLEFTNVVLADDFADLFDEDGLSIPVSSGNLEEDKRRGYKRVIPRDEVNLLYVAATRAKKRLKLNHDLRVLLNHH